MNKIKFDKKLDLKNHSDIYLSVKDLSNFKPSKTAKINYSKAIVKI